MSRCHILIPPHDHTRPGIGLIRWGAVMYRARPWRTGILYLAFCFPASAQVVWDMPNIVAPPAKFDRSTVRARADVCPRLDPGATICKTQADLLRLAEARRGVRGDRPNCQFI